MIIDGEGLVLGRLASSVSKKLLAGERVTVVNAEKIIISGNKEWAYAKYKQRVDRASISNPRRMGPKYPRRPDDIFRRTVRGMLPYKQHKGREALKGLRVHVGTPSEFESEEIIQLEEAQPRNIPKSVELGTISQLLGAKF
ncbi:MAG: large subunit ribosomal protein [Methanobacterium sp.]|jgi:large subunit ribosomal protein L13|uniref:50S ribosomal protein L13 n=1 Tax=Methanobacterium sp. TaxID=2164 RepID=UPI0003C957D9|nr:50S ribosomal protein L13 [Methanobacterium sp.]MDI3549389.1 large subunit ribosomal protein [Methanobacterium sp.]CDG64906.1 50S ribosomal protein L13P [Methanobacterium sp. MB1]